MWQEQVEKTLEIMCLWNGVAAFLQEGFERFSRCLLAMGARQIEQRGPECGQRYRSLPVVIVYQPVFTRVDGVEVLRNPGYYDGRGFGILQPRPPTAREEE